MPTQPPLRPSEPLAEGASPWSRAPAGRALAIAVGLGLLSWLAWAGVDYWLLDLGHESFLEALVSGLGARDMVVRGAFFVVLVAGGYWAARAIARRDRQAELYSGVFSESPDAIYLVDPETGAFVDFNDRACEMLGYSRQELRGLRIRDIDADQSEEVIRAHLDAIVQGGHSVFETRQRARDGRVVEVAVRSRTLRRFGRPLNVAVVTDITERKAHQATIDRINERMALALETGRIGVWEYDLERQTLHWDASMFRLYGVSPDHFDGGYEAWQRAVHPEDLEQANRGARAALAGGAPYDAEFRIIRPDGEVRYIQANARAVKDEHGVIRRLVGTNYDVTALRRSESALKESRALFQDLTENVPGAIFQYTRRAAGGDDIVYMSPGCYDIWELSADALESDPTPLWDMVVPEDLPGMGASIERSATTGAQWEYEWSIRTPSGKLKRLLGRATPRYHDNGDISWNTLIIDISRQRRAEEALDKFFEQSLSLNMIARLDGTIQRANQAWASLLGTPAKELEGRPFLDFVHPDDLQATLAEMSNVARGQTTFAFENRYRDAHGRYHLIRWSSVVSEETGLVYAMAADITESRQVEERLHQAAAVFASTAEGVVITDLEAKILDVNRAFSQITGFARDEVLGRNPGILKSGRHDETFYQALWTALEDTGHWRGEVWNRRKDGGVYPQILTISTVWGDRGQPTGYVGVFTDISAWKETEVRLEHLAHHDPLTDLPNRLLFHSRLRQSLRRAARRKTMVAVVFVDLDRFKQVNDSLGHPVGDELLKELAKRMVGAVRSDDTVGRISGDEFVLLLEDVAGAEGVERLVEKLVATTFKRPVRVEDNEIRITASIGVSLYPRDGEDAETLLRNADAAMYRSKGAGRNTYFFYSPDHDSKVFENWKLERDLHSAIDNEELRLVFQPQIELNFGEVTGLEALLRWQHPVHGAISPARFIPVAEGSGFIRELGAWVLRGACVQGARWLAQGVRFGRLAVNVSGQQLQRGDFADLVAGVLEETGYPPQGLELEVTETFVMRDSEEVIEQLRRLQERGVLIAIDDFGADYSSLSRLKRLPVDRLKIDQSFIRDITHDPSDLAITKTVVAIGNTLRLTVIAEGVETVEHGELLLGVGCELAQGYAIARPMEADQVAGWLRRWQPRVWARGSKVRGEEYFSMLFAGVEHRAWFGAFEKHLRLGAPPPALDDEECPFGRWLQEWRGGERPVALLVEKVRNEHAALHALATDIVSARREQPVAEPDPRLEQLRHLNERILALLAQARVLLAAKSAPAPGQGPARGEGSGAMGRG